jgi:predicted metal-dependent phosphoesterase TrpH
VLAHAIQLRTDNDGQLDRVVKDLLDLGLAGIEVFHSDHNPEWIAKCEKLAAKYKLLKTGGSDFHGTNKAHIPLGTARGHRVPRAFFDDLVAAASRR